MYYYTRPNEEIQQADYQVLLRKFKQYFDVTSMEKALEELQKNMVLQKTIGVTIMREEYICDDRDVLENTKRIKDLTDEEFEEYMKKWHKEENITKE